MEYKQVHIRFSMTHAPLISFTKKTKITLFEEFMKIFWVIQRKKAIQFRGLLHFIQFFWAVHKNHK